MNTNTNETRGTNQNSTSNTPRLETTDVTNKHNADNGTKKHRKIIKCPTVFEWIMIALTIILAIANWRLSEDSGRQIKIAEKNMVFSNAPWFSVSGVVPWHLNTKDTFYVIDTFRNVGKTPANNVMTYTRFIKYTKDYFVQNNIAFKVDSIPNIEKASKGAVAPNDYVRQDFKFARNFTSEEVDSISSGEIIISYMAIIHYDDIFRNKYSFITKYIYDPHSKNFIIDATGNEYKQLQ